MGYTRRIFVSSEKSWGWGDGGDAEKGRRGDEGHGNGETRRWGDWGEHSDGRQVGDGEIRRCC